MDRRGFLSVAGLGMAATLAPAGFASASGARTLPTGSVTASLNRREYSQGALMTLTIEESISKRKVVITDSSGTVWKRFYNDRHVATYTASAGDVPSCVVNVLVTRVSDGATFSKNLSYSVKLLPTSSGGGRWPGHHPGKILLGLSSASLATSLAATGPIGLRRTFYNWGDANEHSTIRADHAAGRVPWVSYKPPGGSVSGWGALASGAHDAEVRAMARRYASYAHPVICTFHHEPTNDGGNPAAWAAAYVRQYDLMKGETNLKNVTFAPIIGDWEFNSRNRDGRPGAYLTAPVLERIPFLGIDLYQNAGGEGFNPRLTRVLDWLDYRGVSHPMVGIGETGCCLKESKEPEKWFQANWDWSVAHTANIGAISYFDSTRNSKDGHVWRLSETQAKLNAYKRALASNAFTTL